ncbi:MAG: hypothetical protein Fues2KO_02470 [Fuerstiella sp.]
MGGINTQPRRFRNSADAAAIRVSMKGHTELRRPRDAESDTFVVIRLQSQIYRSRNSQVRAARV